MKYIVTFVLTVFIVVLPLEGAVKLDPIQKDQTCQNEKDLEVFQTEKIESAVQEVEFCNQIADLVRLFTNIFFVFNYN